MRSSTTYIIAAKTRMLSAQARPNSSAERIGQPAEPGVPKVLRPAAAVHLLVRTGG